MKPDATTMPNNARSARGAGGRTLPTIAVIGCGAIAERYHLPGLSSIPRMLENVILVDSSAERLKLTSERFGIRRQATNAGDIIDAIDGAIVAVPPAWHFPICMELLSRGVHVLCEKPLAESTFEARQMIDSSKTHGVCLCVNHTRRLFPALAAVKRLLDEGAIGELIEICQEEGSGFSWPAASEFHFRSGARGVLFDTGIHGLDTICWWLGAKPILCSSQTDSFGGPESLAEVQMEHADCRIRLKLSWLSQLSNRYTIVGTKGSITGNIDHWSRVTISSAAGRTKQIKLRHAEPTYNDFGRPMVANFVDVVAGRAAPLIPASGVLPALELLDECYQSATRLPMPWLEPREDLCHA
jgi:predicted dehydrogenase